MQLPMCMTDKYGALDWDSAFFALRRIHAWIFSGIIGLDLGDNQVKTSGGILWTPLPRRLLW